MNITERHIPLIERCFNLKLYEHQKLYLLDKGTLESGRRTGKTFAYCIKLALSDGEPLNMRKPEDFADERRLANHRRYAMSYFRHEFILIRNTLKESGFRVRELIQ